MVCITKLLGGCYQAASFYLFYPGAIDYNMKENVIQEKNLVI